MTIKTVTGPSIRAALSDARRLFGADALLLESTPPSGGVAARVTVAFDDAPGSVPTRRASPAPKRAPVIAPTQETEGPHWLDLIEDDLPQPARYGYAAAAPARKTAPPVAEAPSPRPVRRDEDVEALRARIAELEAAVRQPTAAPIAESSGPRVVVLVGPAGCGKTSLALRLAQQPDLAGARAPAVLLLRPAERCADPSGLFWASGVPVASASSASDAASVLADFADADLLIVDTPALPLQPERARPIVAWLGQALQPLAPLDVHFVLDAPRSHAAFTSADLTALGLRPDALALTRLDEAALDAETEWAEALDLPLRFLSSGPDLHDLTTALPALLVPHERQRAVSTVVPDAFAAHHA